ncbi:sphingomyelin synthase-related protein 1 [Caerostris extrusa]|uniref:Sphingomyelin synthase-related protein 1 n=1 Tax=Caerostris extrusa TaxID=172846 RepID=A0AAV4YBN0_CAEEX|nr:sphingomyelin synthase-related protein 1 [Caerostris extrusa]
MGPLKLDQVHMWTIDDVKEWLEDNGFLEYVNLLCIGDIKRLAISVHELQMLNPVIISNWRATIDDSHLYRNSNNGTKPRRRRHRREASDSSDLNTLAVNLVMMKEIILMALKNSLNQKYGKLLWVWCIFSV